MSQPSKPAATAETIAIGALIRAARRIDLPHLSSREDHALQQVQRRANKLAEVFPEVTATADEPTTKNPISELLDLEEGMRQAATAYLIVHGDPVVKQAVVGVVRALGQLRSAVNTSRQVERGERSE
jgi:hypothetical protein